MKMISLFLGLLCCATCVLSIGNNPHPTIVIVGAGPAGIAAASRLFENGFTDVTILEAENRVGGRLFSVKLGEYMVDMGGQWVHGEKDNVAFELAWPLGVIERFRENHNKSIKFFGSSGSSLSPEVSLDLKRLQESIDHGVIDLNDLKTRSFGEFAEIEVDKYMKSHPEISADLHGPLRHTLNLVQMAADAADSWHSVSAKSITNYPECEGDQAMNWKNRTYTTILDILMKKFPDPEKELPVLNNTRMNSKVLKINYADESGPIKVLTDDGIEVSADHVIFTGSLGVLKADYEQLYNPPLEEKKISAIKNLGFGHVAKIWLYYDNPWWHSDEDKFNIKFIYWTDADRQALENDPEKKWMLGILGLIPIENKPKLLCIWMSSNHSIEMELVPEEVLRIQILEFINKFFGNTYNVTEPTEMRRTLWNTIENFRGTYSYHSVETDIANVTNSDLAEPVVRNNKPILLFAGEATAYHYATVHGAIDSGWREADRLINLYPGGKFAKAQR